MSHFLESCMLFIYVSILFILKLMKVQLSSFKVIKVCTIIGWFHINVTKNVLSYFNRVNWGPATSNFTLNIWHASTDFLYHTVEIIRCDCSRLYTIIFHKMYLFCAHIWRWPWMILFICITAFQNSLSF